VLLAGFGVFAPFAARPLPRLDAFIPSLEAIVFVTDFITSVLLLAPEETFHLADACVSCNVEVNPYWDKMKSGCYAPGRFVVPGRSVERVRP
jgi:hypothetical protein